MILVPRTYQDYSSEQEIKRSRFICHLTRTDSEEQAREHIHLVRSMYPDARHHCSAFVIAVPGFQPVLRSSDDGEPSGTAGRPMLDVLTGWGVQNVCAVVVRYFGGIKLGTGGLVRAYSDSVVQTIGQVPVAVRQELSQVRLPVPIADVGRIEAELRNRGWHVVTTEYGASQAELFLALEQEKMGELEATVANLTQGRGELSTAPSLWVEREHPVG